MKSRALISIAMTLCASLVSFHLAAQTSQERVHYKLIILGTLGGSVANPYGGVTDRTWLTGDSNLKGDQTEHAFLWRDGVMEDLGTLGGPDLVSSIGNMTKNVRGWIVGPSQTSNLDKFNEDWVSGTGFSSVPANVFVGFLWKDGVMTALPNPGGNQSAAYSVNNLGQIVGVAETSTVVDPNANCVLPQQLNVEAVVWAPAAGEVRMLPPRILPPLPGDVEGGAFFINDRGQIVGASGQCGPGFPFEEMTHAVLWQDGKPIYLGGLGGEFVNYAAVINNRGQIIGNSDLPNEPQPFTPFTAPAHGFLWQDGVMTDLGTLPANIISSASDINELGQVVGTSCDVNFNCHGFLWEHGVMTDLNALLPAGTTLQVIAGGGINDLGEIAVQVFDSASAAMPFPLALMIPDPDPAAAQLGFNAVSTDPLPDYVRTMLKQRMKRGIFGRPPR
jgi:probable HAF family extracellular repeat protein